MNTARTLRWARRRAGMTQRQLATVTGIAQPTIARIETGDNVPRLDTLQRLLIATGHQLGVDPQAGQGVDRTLIAEMLKRSPAERLVTLPAEARFLSQLGAAKRIGNRS